MDGDIIHLEVLTQQFTIEVKIVLSPGRNIEKPYRIFTTFVAKEV